MNFPSTVYGRCDFSGHMGPEYSTVSSADIVHGGSGSGFKLIEFEGKFICPNCKRRILNDRESIKQARKHSEEEAFRASTGYSRLTE